MKREPNTMVPTYLLRMLKNAAGNEVATKRVVRLIDEACGFDPYNGECGAPRGRGVTDNPEEAPHSRSSPR